MKRLFLFHFFMLLCLPLFAYDQININFYPSPSAPYFIGQPEYNIDSEEFTTVVLKIRSEQGGTARLFWASSYDPQLNEPKSAWFFLKKSATGKEYVFNLNSQNPYWLGYIGQFILFPDSGTRGVIVESAQVVPGNLFLTIKSGWQEFWGPRGRLVIGSTINTIQSPNLFGRSIFIYIYWLIGLIAVGLIIWEGNKYLALKKRPPFTILWESIGFKVFWTVIVFWALLEISSMYSQYFLQLPADWKYVGKSQTEKLTIANYGDFYPFMEFCQKELPPTAQFNFRVAGIYHDIKTKYYLYPRKFTTREAEYLIVYDAQPEPELLAQYSSFKIFRPKALIMKKKGQQ